MDLYLTSKGCEGHPRLITTPTNPIAYLLGVPLLILPGLHLICGLIHLNTILNPLLIRFTHMSSHNLSGMHLNRGGGPSTTLLLLACEGYLEGLHGLLEAELASEIQGQVFTWPFYN